MTEAVILIPGIMGTVLTDENEVVWPGKPVELLSPYCRMAQLLKSDLSANDVIRSVSVSRQYIDLIESLETCGFHEKAHPQTLVVFPYDWRKDNSLAAAGLAAAVDKVATQCGSDAQINLVAHSMGGLVARSYIESGQYNGRPGFNTVKRLITLATPHRGSPMALAAALGQEKRLFLNADQVRTLASDPRYPSVYQLLPPRGEPFAWNRAPQERFEAIDIYEPARITQLGLIAENVRAALNFHATLNLGKRPAGVRYFCFAGTRQTTTSSVQMTSVNAASARVVKIDREYAGDGTGTVSKVGGQL